VIEMAPAAVTLPATVAVATSFARLTAIGSAIDSVGAASMAAAASAAARTTLVAP
jgi:hypothetical protein